MSAKPMPTTRAELANQLREQISDLERSSSSLAGTLLGQGFIVVCERVYLTFDVIDGRAMNPRFRRPDLCTRFSERDARALAQEVKNGNGVRAEAIHVRDAIAAQVAELRDTLTLIETLMQEQPE